MKCSSHKDEYSHAYKPKGGGEGLTRSMNTMAREFICIVLDFLDEAPIVSQFPKHHLTKP